MDLDLTPFPLKFLTLQKEHLALQPLFDRTADPFESFFLQYLKVPISPKLVNFDN